MGDRQQCPHCGSSETDRQDFQFTDFVAVEMRACIACGEPYRVEYCDPVVET